MKNPTIRISNINGSIIDREMTAEELTIWQKDISESEAKAQVEADKSAAKAAAEAKLAALGLDADDLKALGL